jgi:putative cardiolipin synthase
MRARCRRAWLLLAALLVLLAGGCASLPAQVERVPSVAWAPDAALPLARIAAAPDATLSGLALMPTGPAALATRLELLRRAELSIDVQAYHIGNDATGRYFLRQLRDAAGRGVRVRLLLDDLYTAGEDELLLGLAAHPNIELRLFNPFAAGRDGWLLRFALSLADFARVHRRMHNKLLIVDGAVAVAGGRNLADEYFQRRDGSRNFIDLDTVVVGAVLPQLSAIFDRYWNSERAWPIQAVAHSASTPAQRRALFDELTAQAPAPEPPAATDRFGLRLLFDALSAGEQPFVWARTLAYADDPDKVVAPDAADPLAAPSDAHGIRYNLVELIRAARDEVVVSSPYVIATPRSVQTLQLLSARGVRMSVLTNSSGSTDEPLVLPGYRRHRQAMLRLGVELYELVPQRLPRVPGSGGPEAPLGRLHAKAVVIDREIVFIGSFNFDPRSAAHNTEFGLIVFSPPLAARVNALIDFVRSHGAYRLRLAADGSSIEWYALQPDGRWQREAEPAGDGLRPLWLELLAPFVPEDLL